MAESANAASPVVTAPGARLPRPRPIALYLFILSLVALVPAFVFSAILLQRNNQAQEQVVQTLITGTSRSIMQAVEREITANISTIRVLATATELVEGDLALFHSRVRKALEGTGNYVYLLDDKFVSIMSTRVDFPSAPAPSADPASAQRALDGKDVVVSDLVMGKVSQRWVFNILLPIVVPGKPPQILGMTRDAEGLASALLSDKLPDGWRVALIDSTGRTIAGSEGAGHAGDMFTLLDVDRLSAAPGWTEIIPADGQPTVAAVQRSFLTGWTLVAWAPRDTVTRPLSEAFWSLLVGGVLLAAAMILILYWVSLQIGRSVHGLEADAKRLGSGLPVPVRSYPISEIATVSEALHDASQRRQAAETEVRFLMRELAHRSKNQMTVIAAMAKQTAKGADSVPEFVSSFEKRIFGLARSTDLLLAHGIAGVDLRELLTNQIDPFCPVDGERVRLEGPALRLNAQSAQILGMAAHELATNAVKYGAFSTDAGTLHVAWSVADDKLDFTWRERGASASRPGERRGFGTSVLENMVGRSFGAEVTRSLYPDGIEWHFVVPMEAIDPHRAPHGPAEAAEGTAEK